VSLRAADWARMTYGVQGPAVDFGLTVFPFAFFGLFLAVPAARALARRLGDRGRARRNRYRLVVRDVVRARGGPLPDAPGLREAALALEGEPDFTGGERGAVVWKFPRVAEETAGLERYLAGVDVDAERRVGEVIFGGEDERGLEGEGEGDKPGLPPH
jgi:hypothetical protein